MIQSLAQKFSWLDILVGLEQFFHCARSRVDSAKLQRTLEDYARHQDEHQADKFVLETTKSMLHRKVHTLDIALEATKDEISQGFLDGFSVALVQFQAIYPDLDTSSFDPFKIVMDGNIFNE
ncbi:hypothetical protein VNO80_19160 [Phaseolus coccineus]|uniref:Uncharacterized protein n=1 Tax=Phaseolus coccineus TaxID=3886 RepID=A0AAN9MJ06_PHACN